MQALQELFSGFTGLFAAGGILWLLLALAVLLWTLIAERYWYFLFVYPQVQEIALRRSSVLHKARRNVLAASANSTSPPSSAGSYRLASRPSEGLRNRTSACRRD